jgi:hypothetical protein
MKALVPMLCIAALTACDSNTAHRPLNGSITSSLKPGMTEHQVAEVSSNRVPDRIVMDLWHRDAEALCLQGLRLRGGAAGRSVRPQAFCRFRGCQGAVDSNPVAVTSAHPNKIQRVSLGGPQ